MVSGCCCDAQPFLLCVSNDVWPVKVKGLFFITLKTVVSPLSSGMSA
jgi:hypothetical protein